MRKWKPAVALTLFLLLLPLVSALAASGTVTASSLNMRKSASASSDVVKVLRKGDKVSILSSSGSWYKVSCGGSTGFVSQKYVQKGSASASGKSSSGKSSGGQASGAKTSSNGTCSLGDSGNAVKTVQKRLKNLGYYSGSVDGDYGSGTRKAVLAFQKRNGLKQTGDVNSATLTKLKSSGAKKATSNSSSESGSSGGNGTCKPGDSGSAVRAVQKRLKKLGYYSGDIDGDYGNGTKTAVKAFQKRNGLSANGTVNSQTLSKLNSSGAKKADASSSGGGNGTEMLSWFKNGSSRIPKGAIFKVKDIKTGKVFTCKRWSGANHCDTEPLTANDTSIMKSIFGHWSWRRRAVLVKYNGHVYAASMNGMPHGTGTISNNRFDGHFCIHFLGSKTHGSGKVDATHQNCVKAAYHSSW